MSMFQGPGGGNPLGGTDYPTAPVPVGPNPLEGFNRYYNQLYQMHLMSSILHQPMLGGEPGQVPQVPPPAPPAVRPPAVPAPPGGSAIWPPNAPVGSETVGTPPVASASPANPLGSPMGTPVAPPPVPQAMLGPGGEIRQQWTPPTPGGPPISPLGEAATETGRRVWERIQAERQRSIAEGLLDPATGFPTRKGLLAGLGTLPEAFLGTTAAPGRGPAGGVFEHAELQKLLAGARDRIGNLTIPARHVEEPGPGNVLAAARDPTGSMFVSPNIAEHLDFPAASRGLQSRRQEILQQAAHEIHRGLGLDAEHNPAIGAWSDGAENSVMSNVYGGDPDKMRVGAAILGSIAKQKQVLTFNRNPEGQHALYSFDAHGPLHEIHQNLLDDGIAFHTLLPTENGARVHVADIGGNQADAVERGAARYGSPIDYHRGDAEFLGNHTEEGTDADQRAAAHEAYRRTIEGSGVPAGAALSRRIHSTHGAALERLAGGEPVLGARPEHQVAALPPTESVGDVINANFTHGRDLGPRVFSLDSLKGGVREDSAAAQARVDQIRDQITGPGGHWRRPIVDTDGNVLEGQHRVDAARALGVKEVPVHMVQDVGKGIDSGALKGAIRRAQPMHPDQAHQVAQHLAEAWHDEGGHAADIRGLYEPPAGYGKAWEAGIKHLEAEAQVPGADMHASTRVPSEATQRATGVSPYEKHDMLVDYPTATSEAANKGRGTDPGWFTKVANLTKGYVGMRPGPEGETATAANERFITHVRDNLLHIYNSVPEAWRDRAMRWYEGANRIAGRWANEYGYTKQQVAGVLAALSPKKEWFQNVDLAKRMLDYMRDHQDTRFTPQAAESFQNFINTRADPENRATLQATLNHIWDAGNQRGMRLGELNAPIDQAHWIMHHDLAHGSPHFREVTPEGDFGDIKRNKGEEPDEEEGTPGRAGDPTTRVWATAPNIAKALKILRDSSLENISEHLGDAHKVRNFYNNIIAPWSRRGDVTVDTHAIAAGLLRPLGQKAREVLTGLGNVAPTQSVLGLGGTYPMFAEAYRRAAAAASKAEGKLVLPRQMQSVTWEGLRGIFSPEAKRNVNLGTDVDAIWDRHQRGRIGARAARQAILDLATPNGVPRAPSWHSEP